jgi:hypothetical protein
VFDIVTPHDQQLPLLIDHQSVDDREAPVASTHAIARHVEDQFEQPYTEDDEDDYGPEGEESGQVCTAATAEKAGDELH